MIFPQGVQQMYAVEPLKWCEHVDEVKPLPEKGLNVNDPCEDCQNVKENWVCLECYKVFCYKSFKCESISVFVASIIY